MACAGGGVQFARAPAATHEDPDSAIAALEQACLLDPLDASRWEQLGMALRAAGNNAHAETMLRQAATLRSHDLRSDIALTAPPAPPQAPLQETMDRTELVHAGAALVLVRRVSAAVPAASPAAAPMRSASAAALPAAPKTAVSPLRIEISNGNGITGLAARMARTLEGGELKVVRLSNLQPFTVPLSRIEYPRQQQDAARMLSARLGMPLQPARLDARRSDVRIVLGRDVRTAPALTGEL
jgi:tetratricopeptide (TPR) repeat protein